MEIDRLRPELVGRHLWVGQLKGNSDVSASEIENDSLPTRLSAE